MERREPGIGNSGRMVGGHTGPPPQKSLPCGEATCDRWSGRTAEVAPESEMPSGLTCIGQERDGSMDRRLGNDTVARGWVLCRIVATIEALIDAEGGETQTIDRRSRVARARYCAVDSNGATPAERGDVGQYLEPERRPPMGRCSQEGRPGLFGSLEQRLAAAGPGWRRSLLIAQARARASEALSRPLHLRCKCLGPVGRGVSSDPVVGDYPV